MPYGQIDDRTPWKSKVRNASYACRGVVFSAALPYCAQSLTDGILHPDFEADHIRGREARRGFREAIERGFIHPAAELCDRCIAALRDAKTAPPSDGHYLHDYLEHNPSKREVERRRRRNRDKQQAKRERDRQPTLSWEADVTGDSPPHVTPGVEGGTTTSDKDQEPIDARPRKLSAEHEHQVAKVVAMLRRCDRMAMPDHAEVAIETLIAAHLDKDPIAAAAQAVSWVSDPSYRKTWGPSVFGDALRKQAPAAERAQRPQRQSPSDLLRALDGAA